MSRPDPQFAAGRIFDYIRKKGEESDYSAKTTIDKETAERVVNDARKFIFRLTEYLRIQFPGIH